MGFVREGFGRLHVQRCSRASGCLTQPLLAVTMDKGCNLHQGFLV